MTTRELAVFHLGGVPGVTVAQRRLAELALRNELTLDELAQLIAAQGSDVAAGALAALAALVVDTQDFARALSKGEDPCGLPARVRALCEAGRTAGISPREY